MMREAFSSLPDPVYADLLEGDDAYLVVLDVPGATPDSTEIRAEAGRLVIEARRRKSTPDGFRYRSEERTSILDVELPLPPDADGEGAEASLDSGVLELRIPKLGAGGGRRVPIRDA